MFNGMLKDIAGGRILDVGTGKGELVGNLMKEMKSFSEIIGIDSKESSLEIARDKYQQENIKFINMDAGKLEFADESFDTVCISNTLHHLPPEAMNLIIGEMKRVLKKDGNFILCEMYCDNQNAAQKGHVLIHHFGAGIDRLEGRIHNDTYTRAEIISLVKDFELKVIAETDYVDQEKCDDEEIKEMVDYVTKRTESYIDHEKYQEIKEKGQKVIETLEKSGLSGATELALLCR